MNCIINGKQIELEAGTTVGALLAQRELNVAAVVVEFNREVLDRGAFDSTEITDGAEIEILSFVGGGLCE